jgi:hypothetical protein
MNGHGQRIKIGEMVQVYTRYTWASIVFAYAIWHWREFPVWRLASVAAVLLALSLFIVGFCCWMERKPPVVGSASPNYVPHIRCLIISDAGITYDRRRNHPESLDWANVTGVEVVREVDWDMMLINFYWRILTSGGRDMRVWEEEKEYRERRLHAFEKYLPGFSTHAAESCFQSKEQGRWTCFEKSNVS